MYLYHATKVENLNSIIQNGLQTGPDGLVYFTDKEEQSLGWVDLTNIHASDLLIFRVDSHLLDPNKISTGKDHDPNFFRGVVVLTYSENIPFELIDIEYIMQYASDRTPGN